jgi:peptidyl-prolyl cis-trans isomerase D
VAAPDDQSQIVFKVTEADEPVGAGPDSVPDDAKRSFGSGMSNDLLEQLVARLQGEYPVSVDQAAIDRALAY